MKVRHCVLLLALAGCARQLPPFGLGPGAGPAAAREKPHIIRAKSTAQFYERVRFDGSPLLLDFGTSYCHTCREMSRITKRLAREYAPRLTLVLVDVDGTRDVMDKFNVVVSPTLVMFRGRQEVGRLIGKRSEADVRRLVKAGLAATP